MMQGGHAAEAAAADRAELLAISDKASSFPVGVMEEQLGARIGKKQPTSNAGPVVWGHFDGPRVVVPSVPNHARRLPVATVTPQAQAAAATDRRRGDAAAHSSAAAQAMSVSAEQLKGDVHDRAQRESASGGGGAHQSAGICGDEGLLRSLQSLSLFGQGELTSQRIQLAAEASQEYRRIADVVPTVAVARLLHDVQRQQALSANNWITEHSRDSRVSDSSAALLSGSSPSSNAAAASAGTSAASLVSARTLETLAVKHVSSQLRQSVTQRRTQLNHRQQSARHMYRSSCLDLLNYSSRVLDDDVTGVAAVVEHARNVRRQTSTGIQDRSSAASKASADRKQAIVAARNQKLVYDIAKCTVLVSGIMQASTRTLDNDVGSAAAADVRQAKAAENKQRQAEAIQFIEEELFHEFANLFGPVVAVSLRPRKVGGWALLSFEDPTSLSACLEQQHPVYEFRQLDVVSAFFLQCMFLQLCVHACVCVCVCVCCELHCLWCLMYGLFCPPPSPLIYP